MVPNAMLGDCSRNDAMSPISWQVCTYCQRDISAEGDGGFLAPIGEKGQFKDFCAQECLKKYEAMEGKAQDTGEKERAPCAVCQQVRRVILGGICPPHVDGGTIVG